MLNYEQSKQLFAESEYDDSRLADPRVLLAAMRQMRQEVAQESDALFRQWRPFIQWRSFLLSGHNLAAYLALRQRDLRPLQTALMPWGLSSLGRGESRVLANLDAVIATLAAIVQEDKTNLPKHPPLRTFFLGERLLNDNAEALFVQRLEKQVDIDTVHRPGRSLLLQVNDVFTQLSHDRAMLDGYMGKAEFATPKPRRRNDARP